MDNEGSNALDSHDSNGHTTSNVSPTTAKYGPLSTTSSTSSNEQREFDIQVDGLDLAADGFGERVVLDSGPVQNKRNNHAILDRSLLREPQSARHRKKENNGPSIANTNSRRLSLHSNASEDVPTMSLAAARRQFQQKELNRTAKKRKFPVGKTSMSVSRSLLSDTASSRRRKQMLGHGRTLSQNISPLSQQSSTPPNNHHQGMQKRVPSQSELFNDLEYTPRLFRPRKEIKCKPSNTQESRNTSPRSTRACSPVSTTSTKPSKPQTSRRVFDLYERGKQKQRERRKQKKRDSDDDDDDDLSHFDDVESIVASEYDESVNSQSAVRDSKRLSKEIGDVEKSTTTPMNKHSSVKLKLVAGNPAALNNRSERDSQSERKRNSISLDALSIDDDFLTMETAVLEQHLEELDPLDLNEVESSSLSASPDSARYSVHQEDKKQDSKLPTGTLNERDSHTPQHARRENRHSTHSARQLSMEELDLQDDEDERELIDGEHESSHAKSPQGSLSANVEIQSGDFRDDDSSLPTPKLASHKEKAHPDHQGESTTRVTTATLETQHKDSNIHIEQVVISPLSHHTLDHRHHSIDTILGLHQLVSQMVDQSMRYHTMAVVKPLALRKAVQTECVPKRGHIVLHGSLPASHHPHELLSVSCNLYLDNQLLFSDPDVLVVPVGKHSPTFYAHVGHTLEIPSQFYNEIDGTLRDDIFYELIVNYEDGLGERKLLRVQQVDYCYVSEDASNARKGITTPGVVGSQSSVDIVEGGANNLVHIQQQHHTIAQSSSRPLARNGSEASFMTPISESPGSLSVHGQENARKDTKKCCVIS